MESISFTQSVTCLVRGEVRQLWTFPVHVTAGTSKLAYTPGLIFSVIRVIWETKKAPKLLLLEERASVSNLKTTTRGSTHYTSLGGKEQEATEGVGGENSFRSHSSKRMCCEQRDHQAKQEYINQAVIPHPLTSPGCTPVQQGSGAVGDHTQHMQ